MTKRKAVDLLTSLKLTIACLVLLMVLVTLCTFDQAELGTFGAVEKYFRSFFLYLTVPGLGWRLPVFPAGGFVGAALLANLAAVLAFRLKRTRRQLGSWLIHVGLVVLVLGEFATGMFAVETRMAVEEGASADYTESPREVELALVDRTDPDSDETYAVRGRLLRPGRKVRDPRLPFAMETGAFYPNARLESRGMSAEAPPSRADRGAGPALLALPMAPVPSDDERDQPAAYVELSAGGRSLGTWLVSTILEPQEFEHAGRRYSLALRPRRRPLPFSLTLKDFRHDVYPGTDIPKNFASLVRIRNPAKGEERDALIYMNHPLRYEGLAFYQASYGKGDTLSVFQVVENPGWLLPYIAFVLMGFGLLYQFGLHALSFKPRGASR